MTNKNLFFSAFLLIISFSSYSQKPTVKWGDVITDEKQTEFRIIGQDEQYNYILRFQLVRTNRQAPFLVKVDRNTLQVAKSVELRFNVPDDGDLRFEDVFYIRDRFIVFLSLTGRKSKMDAGLAYELNKDGQMNSNYKIILEAKEGINTEFRPKWRFLMTPDSARFIAAAYLPYGENQYNAGAYEANLSPIWKTEFNLKTNVERSHFITTAIGTDMDANLYVMAKPSNKLMAIGEPTSTVYVYNAKSKNLKHFDITPEEKGMTISSDQGRFISSTDGHVLYIGLYGKTRESTGTIIINCTPEKMAPKFKPFSEKFRSAFMPDAKAVQGKSISMLQLDTVILNNDNSFDLICYMIPLDAMEGAVVTKFDKTFNEVWSVPVPASARLGPNYSSLMEMTSNDQLYILFNDLAKNANVLDPRLAKKVQLMSDAVSVIVTIDLKNGSITKQPLFDSGNITTILMPVKCKQSGPNEMLLFAKKKANVNFGILTLE
jgi:hypothetical protein